MHIFMVLLGSQAGSLKEEKRKVNNIRTY